MAGTFALNSILVIHIILALVLITGNQNSAETEVELLKVRDPARVTGFFHSPGTTAVGRGRSTIDFDCKHHF